MQTELRDAEKKLAEKEEEANKSTPVSVTNLKGYWLLEGGMRDKTGEWVCIFTADGAGIFMKGTEKRQVESNITDGMVTFHRDFYRDHAGWFVGLMSDDQNSITGQYVYGDYGAYSYEEPKCCSGMLKKISSDEYVNLLVKQF